MSTATAHKVELNFKPLPWVWASGYDLTQGKFEYNRPGFWESQARFRMICGGRRLSKTHHAVPELALGALEKRGVYWWVGNIYKITKKAWRLWQSIVPLELIVNQSKTELWSELINGSLVFFMSAENEDALVSEGLDGVVCDEMQLWRETAWKNQIHPSLIDTGGWAIGLFTVAPKHFTKKLFANGQDPSLTSWDSWNFSTYANTALTQEEIYGACQGMDWLTYMTQILAQYPEEEGAVFRNVRGRATVIPLSQPQENHHYILAVDWGKRQDYTVIGVIDVTASPRRLVNFYRFKEINYGLQLSRLKEIIRIWNPLKVRAEQNGIGDPLIDMLVRDLPGVYVEPINVLGGRDGGSKNQLIDKLSLDIERGDILFPADEVLMGELENFGYKATKSGGVKYEANAGWHDDTVMMLAIGNGEGTYIEPSITAIG